MAIKLQAVAVRRVYRRLGNCPPIVATRNTSTTRPATKTSGAALDAHPVVPVKVKPPFIPCLLCLVGGPFLLLNEKMPSTCLTNACTTRLALVYPMPPWKRNILQQTMLSLIWPNGPTTVPVSTTVTPATAKMASATVHVFATAATTITVVRGPTNARNAPTPPPIGD